MLREMPSPWLLGAQQRRQTSANLWKGWGVEKSKAVSMSHSPGTSQGRAVILSRAAWGSGAEPGDLAD